MDVPLWLARWKVTSTWAQHVARGSAGGVDYGAPLGTDILAPPGGGRLTFRYLSDGSSVLRVQRADGTATEFLHGHPVGVTPRDVAGNEHIGESGGASGTDGAGASTGAHIHVHDIGKDGKRAYPYSTIGSSTAGGGTDPIENEDDMTKPQYFIANDNGGLTVGVGINDVWVRSAPGEPLRRMTQGQWGDYNNARTPLTVDVDYFWKPGAWFALAFQEDNVVHGYNVGAHPWLEPDGVASLDPDVVQQIAAETASATERTLQDEFGAIPGAVLDEQAERLQS